MKPTVLVTGASGYLGSLLIKRLLEKKYPTYGISRKRSPSVTVERSHFQVLDLAHFKQCRQTFLRWRPDIVIHTAGRVHIALNKLDARETALFHDNVQATFSLLNASVLSGVKLFVFLSTLGVYGNPQRRRVTEKHKLEPDSFYAATKLIGEKLLETYTHLSPMKGRVLRPMGFFGETRRIGLVYTWIQNALKGRQIRVPRGVSLPWNTNCVNDVIDAILLVIKKGNLDSYSVYNIGYEEPIQLRKLASFIVNTTRSNSRIQLIKKGRDIPFAYDTTKARKELGWKPKTIEERLCEYIEVIKGNTRENR